MSRTSMTPRTWADKKVEKYECGGCHGKVHDPCGIHDSVREAQAALTPQAGKGWGE